MDFKPMLSASLDGVDLSTLRYPLVISTKLDGLRCIVWEGVAYSRNAKPFRNRAVQKWASDKHNMDGELIVGSPTEGLVLERSKAVTAFEGEPDFKFYMFDSPGRDDDSFFEAYQHWRELYEGMDRVVIVPQILSFSEPEIRLWEHAWLAAGYEGVMLRSRDSPYKYGRSTLREGYLMKLKNFTDGEAVVVWLEEGKHNANELQRDELDRAKRSTHAENLIGNGMVGTIICDDPKWGRIRVSPGIMTHEFRARYWRSPEQLVGKTIHWRSFLYGTKDAPRFARFYGIKEDV